MTVYGINLILFLSRIGYLFRWFANPWWFQRHVNTTSYVFDVVDDKQLNAPIRHSNYVFHEPQLFRHHHLQREPLSIKGCKDISI